jgi:hypothetical protein
MRSASCLTSSPTHKAHSHSLRGPYIVPLSSQLNACRKPCSARPSPPVICSCLRSYRTAVISYLRAFRRELAITGERGLSVSLSARPGDVVVVTRLDRLARSTLDLLTILKSIADRGARLTSLAETWADTTTATGRLMLTILGGLAEFERELIKARTAEGRERAEGRGVRMGRKHKLTPHQMERKADGQSVRELGRSYNVSPNTQQSSIDPCTFAKLSRKFLKPVTWDGPEVSTHLVRHKNRSPLTAPVGGAMALMGFRVAA